MTLIDRWLLNLCRWYLDKIGHYVSKKPRAYKRRKRETIGGYPDEA